MKIAILIGDKTLTASMADNATARDFASLLPLTVAMNDLFGREKYGDLPKALSESGPRKKRYEVGDVVYWSPEHQFAVYYQQNGESIPPLRIIPIAKIHAGVDKFNVPGSVKVSIEVVKQYQDVEHLGQMPLRLRRADVDRDFRLRLGATRRRIDRRDWSGDVVGSRRTKSIDIVLPQVK